MYELVADGTGTFIDHGPIGLFDDGDYSYRWMRSVRGHAGGRALTLSQFELGQDWHSSTTRILSTDENGELVLVAEFDDLWSPAATWADSSEVRVVYVPRSDEGSTIREARVALPGAAWADK